MEDKIAEINSRIANSFSKVKVDINDIRRNSEGIRKEFAEKFIDRSDYVKLFTEYSNLKKEHSALIAEMRNELYKAIYDIKAASKKQIDALEKRNEALKKALKKELAKKANDKEAKRLLKEIKDVKTALDKTAENCMNKSTCETELADLNEKLDTTVTDINERVENKIVDNKEYVSSSVKDIRDKMDHLLNYSVEVNDVENNFITQKRINKELDSIRKQLYKKDAAEKEFSNINKKIVDMKNELSEIGDILKLTTYTLQETAKMKDVEQQLERFTDKAELEAEIKKAESRMLEINNAFKDFKAQIARALSKREITQDDVAKIQEDITRIKENMLLKRDVEKALVSNSSKMEDMKKEFEWVEEKIKQLFKNVDDHSSRSENRHLLKTKEVEDINRKIEHLISLFSKLSAKGENIDLLNKQVAALSKTADSLRKDLNDKAAKRDNEKALITLSEKISSLRNDLDSVEDAVKKVEKAKTFTVEASKGLNGTRAAPKEKPSKDKQKKKR